MVYLTGKVTVELDGKAYFHADVGRLAFTGDTPEALDTALSGAATDCLKRCFRQCGDQFGLSLYDKEMAKIAGAEALQGSKPGRNGNRRDRDRSSPGRHKDKQNGMTVVIAFYSLRIHQQAMRALVGERDERAIRTAAIKSGKHFGFALNGGGDCNSPDHRAGQPKSTKATYRCYLA